MGLSPPQQSRHPERSASQIYRIPEGLWRAVEGPRRCLLADALASFPAAIAREKQLKGWRREKKLNLIRTINTEFKDLAETWEWKMITVHEKMSP